MKILHTIDTLWAVLHGNSSDGCYLTTQWTEADGETAAELNDPEGVYRVEVRSHETPITDDPAYFAQAPDAHVALETIVKTLRGKAFLRRDELNDVLDATESYC